MIETERDINAEDVVRMLQRYRLDLSTEKHLQADVEQALLLEKVNFIREKRLSAQDIPDFFIAGGIIVECKMRNKTSKVSVYKQIRRYADHMVVKSIVLATNLSMGLPAEINGKPIFVASLSRGWI